MSAQLGVTLALGAAAIFEDLRLRRIPNGLTAVGFAAALAVAACSAGWRGLATAVAGAAVGFAVFLLFFLLRAMGGGDIKLMAAFGALLGPAGALTAGVLAAIAGALMALAATALNPRGRAIPYAPAIVAGCWLAYWGQR